jgi:hypothetical protein
MSEPVSPERQMARLETLGKLAKGIEKAIDTYRDFPRDRLSNGEFVAQILLAISNENVAFYLDANKGEEGDAR